MKPILLLLFLFGLNTHGALTDFTQAVDKIVKRDPRIGSGKALVQAAKWNRISNNLYFLPTLSMDGSRSLSRSDGESTTTHSANFTAGVNLLKFGADYQTGKAAKYDWRSQKSAYSETVVQVENDAIKRLLDFIFQKKNNEIQHKILKINQDALQIARARFKQGLLPGQEVLKVEVDFGNARARLKSADQGLSSAQGALESRLGEKYQGSSWPWMERLKKVSKEKLSASSIRQRPRLKQLEWDLKSAKASSSAAFRSIFPTLDLSVSYGYLRRFGLSNWQWQGAVTLTIPLFERASDYAAFQRARAQKMVKDAELRLFKRDLENQNRADQENFNIALETALERERIVQLSRKLYKDNQKRFSGGRVSANELAQDQSRLLESEKLAADGWQTVHQQFADLCAGMGLRIQSCFQSLGI